MNSGIQMIYRARGVEAGAALGPGVLEGQRSSTPKAAPADSRLTSAVVKAITTDRKTPAHDQHGEQHHEPDHPGHRRRTGARRVDRSPCLAAGIGAGPGICPPPAARAVPAARSTRRGRPWTRPRTGTTRAAPARCRRVRYPRRLLVQLKVRIVGQAALQRGERRRHPWRIGGRRPHHDLLRRLLPRERRGQPVEGVQHRNAAGQRVRRGRLQPQAQRGVPASATRTRALVKERRRGSDACAAMSRAASRICLPCGRVTGGSRAGRSAAAS